MHSLLLVAGFLGAWAILKAARPLAIHPRRGIRMASSFMLLALLPASALTVAITTFLMLIADRDCFARTAPWDQIASVLVSMGVIAYFGASVTRSGPERLLEDREPELDNEARRMRSG